MLCFYSIESPTIDKEIHEARSLERSVHIRQLMVSIARDLYNIITSHKDLDGTYKRNFYPEDSTVDALNKELDRYIDPIHEVVWNYKMPWNWEASTDDMKALARKYPEIEFVLCTADTDTNVEWREFFLGDKYHLSNSFLMFEKFPEWSMTEYDDEI